MKIHAKLELESGLASVRTLVRALCALPDGLRPTRHSQGEDQAGRAVDDVERYVASLKGGPLLRGRGVLYNIMAPMGRTNLCSCYFNAAPPNLVRAFMERMAAIGVLFGYACTWEEKQHRNRIFAEIVGGEGRSSESFRGTDIAKYVPGLYWLTLLPEALAERHGVPLAEVSAAALEHVDLGGGQHLFRFHDGPEDWPKRIDAMDDLCARLPGVFDVLELRRQVAAKAARSFAELDEVTDPWP